MYTAAAKAHRQTGKRRVRGCFKKLDKRRHMNGRIYDPLIGRFMSADPFIQAPFDLQSHNRYAYVMNNPLGYTDPSAATPVQAAKAGVIAWGTAGAFEWAGTKGTGAGVTEKEAAKSLTRYAAHAGVGCASSVAGGGQCGSGAAAAVLGKWVTNSTSNWGAGIAEGTAAAVAGGVGSVIAGGKFENGARTAAFGYLFNQVMSERGKQERAARIAQNEKLTGFLSEGIKQSPENSKIAGEVLKTLIVIAIPPLAVPSTVIDGIVVINDLYNNDRGEAGKGALSMSVGNMTEGALNANGARPGVSNRVGTGVGFLWDQFVKLF